MNYLDDTAGTSALPRRSFLPVDAAGPAASEDAHQQLMDELQSSHPLLLHWMRRRLGDGELAADLLNHAVRITLEQQRSGQLQCGSEIAGHVFKIGMRLLRKEHRKSDHRPQLHLVGDAVPPASLQAPAQTGHDEQLRQTVRALLESLSWRERQLIAQLHLDSTDKQSLCRQFSVSSRQFNAILARVRQRMKAMLEARGRN